MRPDRARYLLQVYNVLGPIAGKAPEYLDALETIAGMTPEYAIAHQIVPGGEWHQVTRWSNDQHPINKGYELADDERIIIRYVTEPQPLGEHP